MRKTLRLILLLVLCTSCSHRVHRQAFSFHLVADTLRQGGLELLHNIAIVNAEGTVLFTDSTKEYEPDHFVVLVTDSAHPENSYLLLMLFDPCEDRTLVLHSENSAIRPYSTPLHPDGIFPSDSLPVLR